MAIRRCTLRSALPVLAFASALALSGCSGGADAESQGPPTASPSASATATPTPSVDSRPTPASSTGPARNLPKPEMPAAAKENTKAGFEAFTQYWFDAVTYALETGDTAPLKAISKPDCKICNGYIARADRVAGGNGWNVGPRWTVKGFSSTLKLDPLGQALGYFLIDESAATQYSRDGSVAKSQQALSDDAPKAIYAIYANGKWLTTQAGNA
ncbi:hypothetical protein SA2016_1340 [Sinomonas atrocyanea]|uniref:DUF6318 domain-containing protein n=1 Tax=Sinomonas atrocyanea TaxID=37927 RepID=A0A126ZXW7_9MICC|nr:DUF6318 family protein [Sinomonas atrocyanea]AMM32020.1 hypothetical protein SA2016_1340 [Sinomonas atrocyanea]GEB65191.1 hypothetical protein SAT01_26390 [Sinomonas atrocyanea]GGG69353.1 hypothetical protein GCM10007172_21820 [Sinomonas atrocyanea]